MIFKLLSILLRYPDDEILRNRAPISGAVRELPDSPARNAMVAFLAHWENEPVPRLQTSYIEAFDFKRRGCLYLSYYRYGDQRARGQVLADMKGAYARAGYPLDTTELPDYLPLVLEFASEVPEEGLPMLAESRAAVEVIRRSLRHDGSPYAHLVEALIFFLPRLDEETVAEMQRLIVQGPPQESVGLEPYAADAPPGEGSMTSCSRGGSVEPVAPVLVGDLPLPLARYLRARSHLPLSLRPVRRDTEVESAPGAAPPDVGRLALPLGLSVRLRRSRDGSARAHRGLPRHRGLGPQLPPALPVGRRSGRDRRHDWHPTLERPPLVHTAHPEQHRYDQVPDRCLAPGGDRARARRHDRLSRLRQPVRAARGVRVPRQRGHVVP